VQKIYLAGPLFNSLERRYLELIADTLEMAGFQTFLPHRDVGVLSFDSASEERARIFLADCVGLDACDMCVALLIGPDHDSGTSAELGYMHAKGKPCFGVSDDIRGVNNFIWGLCNCGRHIYPTVEELLHHLRPSDIVVSMPPSYEPPDPAK
jgi:nucleoside 2-deoxyribosyltransferase